MRPVATALFALTVSALLLPAARAGDDVGESPPSSRMGRRALHDVRVAISKARTVAGGVKVRVTVRNRGRAAERDVVLSILSDADPLAPVWTATTDLRRRGHRSWKLVLEVPDGTTRLTATAACESASDGSGDADDRPYDNTAETSVDPSSGTGGTGDPATTPAGAVLYTSLCSGCHGATGHGGTVDDDISRKPASELLEAFREGEDGMPVFPGLTWQDARDIAAWLANPVAPPTGTGGTGSGGGGTGGASTPTFSGDIASILSANCTACHAGTAATANIRLDTYTSASTNASKALAAITAGRMPPAGPLSSGTIATLQAWIAAGKPR